MANASWRGKFHLARDPAHTIAHIGNDDNMVLKAIYPYRRLNRNVSFGSFVSWNGISQPPLHDGPPYKSNFGSRPGSAGGFPIGANSQDWLTWREGMNIIQYDAPPQAAGHQT